jgi:hypothetical protein
MTTTLDKLDRMKFRAWLHEQPSEKKFDMAHGTVCMLATFLKETTGKSTFMNGFYGYEVGSTTYACPDWATVFQQAALSGDRLLCRPCWMSVKDGIALLDRVVAQ